MPTQNDFASEDPGMPTQNDFASVDPGPPTQNDFERPPRERIFKRSDLLTRIGRLDVVPLMDSHSDYFDGKTSASLCGLHFSIVLS